MKLSTSRSYIAILLALLSLTTAHAQDKSDALTSEILHQDSLFWQAYNTCDVNEMAKFMTDDLEFYHDKGGIQKGINEFRDVSKKNLCSNEKLRVRREPVKGSLKVFPMKKQDSLYGAILSGEHLFYILEAGKKERLTGLAKFTHLWILTGRTWKMSRVLSYDHGPAPYVSNKTEISLPLTILDKYTGKYTGTQTKEARITRNNGLLTLTIGQDKFDLHASSETTFFMVERDLEFEFVKNAQGKVSGLVVKENGAIAEELTR